MKNWAKRVVRRPASTNMVLHVQILIECLKLGPLRVKIRRIKPLEGEAVDKMSETTEVASNLDMISGIGTAGDARIFLTDFDREDLDTLESDDNELEFEEANLLEETRNLDKRSKKRRLLNNSRYC